ncbi:MAG TPA: hypothetical protein VKZ99_07905 [Gammaproteobacteria bacterium]|nr:hypothetical protein [Gammaproteobacteria bacterium]
MASRNGLPACVAVAFAMLLGGCVAAGGWLRSVEQPLYHNQPDLALKHLESAGQKDGVALYLIHKGLLLRMAGDIEGSIAAFEAAKPLITFQEATSISELASSLVLTEGLGGYQPPPFEQIQLHFYQALNRLELGDLEGARVEAMQIDILLQRRWGGFAPHGADATARYLSGLIFEANGEPDDALIAYRKAYQVYREHGRVPVDLQRRLLRLAYINGLDALVQQYLREFGDTRLEEALQMLEREQGELVLIAATGLVPHRREEVAMHFDPQLGFSVAMALPALSFPHDAIASVAVRHDGRVLQGDEVLADLAELSGAQLEAEMPALMAKAIARNVARAIAAREAAEEMGAFGSFMVNVAGAAMEAADIRSWSTLPRHIRVVSVPLAPGTYTGIEVDYHGSNGHVATQSLGREIHVRAGMPTIVGVHRVSP